MVFLCKVIHTFTFRSCARHGFRDVQMKKTGLFGLVVLMLLAVTVTSCQKKKVLSKTISSDRVSIDGKNSDLFEIEDPVKLMLVPVGVEGDKWEIRADLPIKNTTPWNEIPGSDPKLDHSIYGVSIYANYIDQYNMKVDLDVQTDYQGGEKLLKSNELITGNVPIIEYGFGDKSYKKQKAYFDLIDGIDLTVELKWAHKSSSSSSTANNTTVSSSSFSQDWNKMLDDYEKNVNEYVKYVKKLSKGDKSVESKVDKYYWAAEDLDEDLEKAYKSGKMTSAQKKRYEKIDDKFTDAVFEYDE